MASENMTLTPVWIAYVDGNSIPAEVFKNNLTSNGDFQYDTGV